MGTGTVVGVRVRPPPARGLARPRVDALLGELWSHRLTLVIAPAGSGKTTALALFAAQATSPVAWYQADGGDGTEAAVLAHVDRALGDALRLPPCDEGRSLAELPAALERWPGGRAALVIDDFHVLKGTAGEQVVGWLVDAVPPSVSVVLVSRVPPGFDVTRRRLAGEVLDVGADQLRFRTWEAEQLFADVYRTQLPPEDIARLTRRVEGWAAGLQLYQLAARGRSALERQRLIDAVGSRSRLGREYLARNVLEAVPLALRNFLVDTCVLGVVTPALADALLGGTGSAAMLAELEANQLFTIPIDDEGTYRYHEVLRSHLEVLLVERDGADAARRRHREAAVLLEADGHLAEAVRGFGRAGEWAEVARVLALGRADPDRTHLSFRWLDPLPAAIVDDDPGLLLARARARVAAGTLTGALSDLAEAERLATTSAVAEACRSDRRALAGWLDPLAPPPPGWSGALRQALRRDPLALDGAGTAEGRLVRGVAALAAGHLGAAGLALAPLDAEPSATTATLAAGGLARAVIAALAAAPDQQRVPGSFDGALTRAVDGAEGEGLGWLARVGRAAMALTSGAAGIAEAGRLRRRCDADGDAWGAALAALAQGLGCLGTDAPARPALEDAIARFQRLDAPVLSALGEALRAADLARHDDPDATRAATSAEHAARMAGSPGARALAVAALVAGTNPRPDSEVRQLARQLAHECGLAPLVAPLLASAAADDDDPLEGGPATMAAGSVEIRCFGAFHIKVDGRPLPLATVRPRARSLLRLLAVRAGRPIHREQLMETLWPNGDRDAGLRNLQVAVSALRRVLPANRGLEIVRDGVSYRLALPAGALVDLRRFEAAVASAHEADQRGDPEMVIDCARLALSLCDEELLVEEGPAEWAVEWRDQHHAQLVALTALAGAAALALGRFGDAAGLAERGLLADRYADPLWKLVIMAHERAGEVAAAARTRGAYDAVRRDLGLVD